MYPLEEDEQLYNYCHDCGYKEIYEGSIIEKKIFKTNNNSQSLDTRYLIYDNTLPVTNQKQCPNKMCDKNKKNIKSDAIFLQDPISLKLTYICTSCNVEWKYS